MSDKTTFLTTARARWKQATDADLTQRERELADLRFYAGEQWDPDILRSRQGQSIGSGTNQQIVPARPSLVINKTREPVRQVLNQERQSDMGIELVPADDFGDEAGPIDDSEIKLREGLIRRIQRDSEAADARTWGFARSTIAGRGCWGVMTRYVPGSFDQEVYIHRFYNQSSVVFDPAHEQPDASDAEWAFVGTNLSWERYVAEYGERNGKRNRIANMNDDEWRMLGDEAPGWFTTSGDGDAAVKSVRVVEYWYTVRETVTLTQLSTGKAATEEQLTKLPAGVTVLLDDKGKPVTRTDVKKTIKWAKIDGCNDDVLDETDWPGRYIPLIKTVGEELQPYDQERRCEGIVRPMRDACQGNNYIVSKFVERVGLTPISPWMMASGQDEGFEDEYNASNTRSLSRLHYNPVDSFGKPVPPPFRTDARAEIADIGMGVQIFGQAIVSTSVVPETALGNVDPSVKSGKLAKALIEQANRGTSNFLDNLMRSMRHEARIVNDLLYPIYGTRPGRLARMMNPEGEMSAVVIGQPFTMAGEGKTARPQLVPNQQTPPAGAQTFTLTPDAEFNVAVKISKNYDTRREQEADTLGELISSDPQLMQVFGDLFFKYQDGPGHEEMSERMKAVLVQPVQQLLAGGKPDPQQLQQQLQQQSQIVQQLTAHVNDMSEQLKTKALERQTELDKADKDNATKIAIARINQEGQFAVADLKAGLEAANQAIAAMDLERKAFELSVSQIHDAGTQGREHAHELKKAALDHQQKLAQAAAGVAGQAVLSAQGHTQALEQNEQGQAHALEQGQQAADLAPEPAQGANA